MSAELLRAWERRYGLLSPTRTAGGFRLYGDDDERRVRRMLRNLDSGLSAAEGARLALAEGDDPAPVELRRRHRPRGRRRPAARSARSLRRAGAHAALDRLLATFTLETVLRDAVLPYLHELGDRWQRGEASIAQEHFASALLRGRLLGLARGWGSGGSPLALLACLPGDQHDLGLICFGLALRGHGWRITFLGPDTPLATIIETARHARGPRSSSLTATTAASGAAPVTASPSWPRSAPLALAGTGTSAQLAEAVGAALPRGRSRQRRGPHRRPRAGGLSST